ncbi:hypothetical protein [Turneriella parva]|uniref:Lipoprotein n=1 Tax=Turneriella parva (strain ATCC BAA-1111 / DSM 21527 / NCTC 11395 / H) TaxID=869212 RepID=I4B7N8_TURPD|nr:hypothetical protein [Turneriella parva]AFM13295.1 hypothetical protein Turpa_2655 [Turneriella parva DSM 21527]
MKPALLTLLLSIAGCGTSIPFDQELTLKRPTGLNVVALSGRRMQVEYYVQNQEDTFDGYNLLISRVSIGDSEVFTQEPLIINGSVPTFLHSSSEFNVSALRTVIIDRLTNVLPFEVGTTYFFRIQAHSRKGVRSEGSNEVQVTALP